MSGGIPTGFVTPEVLVRRGKRDTSGRFAAPLDFQGIADKIDLPIGVAFSVRLRRQTGHRVGLCGGSRAKSGKKMC